MELKGQVSLELIMIIGFILILILGIASFLGTDNELNQVMSAARSGAIEGANTDSFAIYPEETFKNYTIEHMRLLNPSSVKIIKIDYTNQGFDEKYNKTKIQLRISASAPSVTDISDRNVLGDRVNFYVRKSICGSFSTSNQTNDLFNPAFSNRYVLTTADVTWI
ncbi:hypothetical protein [Methanobacterium sp. MBAC-LM]|jgi:uncharacterized protein (UPF0333 family)|uniref:hypothetical protein n=1 Tax=Methanobacterium sp. MBAC-LM TaxID=3412034 RepID=UPI003C792BDF